MHGLLLHILEFPAILLGSPKAVINHNNLIYNGFAILAASAQPLHKAGTLCHSHFLLVGFLSAEKLWHLLSTSYTNKNRPGEKRGYLLHSFARPDKLRSTVSRSTGCCCKLNFRRSFFYGTDEYKGYGFAAKETDIGSLPYRLSSTRLGVLA